MVKSNFKNVKHNIILLQIKDDKQSDELSNLALKKE